MRESIVDYYNTWYGSSITPENVMIFGGGRPRLRHGPTAFEGPLLPETFESDIQLMSEVLDECKADVA